MIDCGLVSELYFRIKCHSSNNLNPITIRIRPPIISIRWANLCDRRFPIFIADQVMALAVIPIHTATKNRLCFKTPRPKPTPSASMLVAKDSITRLKPLVGSGHSVSSSAGTAPWRSIRAPINSSKPKAIHGPQVSAQIRTYLPDNQPTSGIINWKRPKWNDSRKTCRGAQHVVPTPSPTAKASKPRATDIKAISNIFKVNGFHPGWWFL